MGNRVQVSDLERRVTKKAAAEASDVGTYDVLKAASGEEAFAGKRLFLVLGADMTNDLCNNKWKNQEGLLNLLEGILVIPRQGVDLPSERTLAEKLDGKYTVWKKMQTPAVSSTHVRESMRRGLDQCSGVDPLVFVRMKALGMYSDDADQTHVEGPLKRHHETDEQVERRTSATRAKRARAN